METQANASVTEQIQSISSEKDNSFESNASKIWSEIKPARIKESIEVIEILEQKGPKNDEQQQQSTALPVNGEKRVQFTLNEIIQVQANNDQQQKEKLTQNPLLNPFSDDIKVRRIKDKEDYTNRELFLSDPNFLQTLRQQRQNQLIHQQKTAEFHKQMTMSKSEIMSLQVRSVEHLLSIPSQRQTSVITLIDLLYKKFILKPVKDSLNSSNAYDIYKPSPIFNQRLYYLADRKSQSQKSTGNSFKRNGAGKGYGDNYVSLLENDSTNDFNDPNDQGDLDSMASSYANSMRKVRMGDFNGNVNRSPQELQAQKMRKPYPLMNSQSSLPFEIKMPGHALSKQMTPTYNVLQSQDQEKSERFKQERDVAKTFVKEGYGLSIARNYIGPHMQGGSYNRAITTIIRQSYKKIEEFLSKQCNIKIHNLTSSEFSLVKTPLVHCRNILKEHNLRTFFKFIAITYSFGKLKQADYPTAQDTLDLYNAIIRGLNDRKAAKQMSPKSSLHKDLYFKG